MLKTLIMINRIIKKILGANNILRIKLYYYFATSNFLTSKPLATEKEYLKLHYDYIQKIKNNNVNYILHFGVRSIYDFKSTYW